MPTPKNGFQILNLHPKKHIYKEKKNLFFNVLLPKYYRFLYSIKKHERSSCRTLNCALYIYDRAPMQSRCSLIVASSTYFQQATGRKLKITYDHALWCHFRDISFSGRVGTNGDFRHSARSPPRSPFPLKNYNIILLTVLLECLLRE